MNVQRYRPMLPVIETGVDTGEFVHEIKWDGFRTLAYVLDDGVDLESRNGHSLNERFPQVLASLGELQKGVMVLDGEVVALTREGKVEFSLLRHAAGRRPNTLYVVFDLLFFQGQDLCALPWHERRYRLETLILNQGAILLSPLLPGNLADCLTFASEHDLEGIVSKKSDSPYLPGERSPFWRKHKLHRTLDCIVIGLNMEGGRVRSLVLGLYEGDGRLRYVGSAGSGLGHDELDFLNKAITLLGQEASPVFSQPKQPGDVKWFKPHLVVEVKYTEFTPQLYLRHPVIVRFRFDKDPKDCLLEV